MGQDEAGFQLADDDTQRHSVAKNDNTPWKWRECHASTNILTAQRLSFSLSLPLRQLGISRRRGTVSLPLSAAASICWAKTSACEVFLAKAKQAEPRMLKKNDNNKKIRQAEEVEDKMVSKNLPKFMKVKLKGSKYEYIFQFFNMYFCITFMPTNTSSTNKMCRLAGFFVLLCWNEPWRHITCLQVRGVSR